MKTENKPNRRFCDVGDFFYLKKDDNNIWILKCNHYYKSTYMKYEFKAIPSAKHSCRKADSPLLLYSRTFFRDHLDALWNEGLLTNLTDEDKAHESLLGIDL